ncbi:MAG: hypothetical protein O3A00_02850 [Planctomycetota bacterium]|nr:hypothetical protein [Planctomycetota bacterium]
MPMLAGQQFQIYFEQRRDAFQELLRLSERQRACIAEDDYTQLLAVLSDKQNILNRVSRVHRQHDNMIDRWQNARDEIETVQRTQCDELLAESESLVSRLMDTDQKSTHELQERRDTAHEQLQRISHGSVTQKAYSQEGPAETHRFLDVGQ